MRIGVDLLAIQAPSCRGRGIGRYAKSLLRALLVEAPGWEFVFFRRADLAIDWDDDLDDRVSEWVDVAPDPRGSADGTLQGVVQDNRQGLDWLLVPNPVVERRGFALPEPVPGGPRLAAVVHDLIPALFPRSYLDGEGLGGDYYRDLRRLQAYDLLLTNSASTARDVHTHLRVPERRIVNIRAAADPAFFRPADPAAVAEAEADARLLADFGIAGPFLYDLGNVDWRKNVLGLVDAYAMLPEEVRAANPLVLTFGDNAWFRAVLAERVAQHGLGDRVVSTGPLTDETARAFLRRATLFLSPSRYEGFGLPILEALQCGAAVVVADNSSQPEVAGPAGVLARTDDPADWAATIAALVRDPDRLASLRRSALDQAATFSWPDSARRLRDALESAPRREDVSRRVAIVPWPSASAAGFDAGCAEVFKALCRVGCPVIFADTDRAPALPPLPMALGWHDRRLLGRIRRVLGKPPVLYLVDTLETFGPLLDDLRAHPGVVAFARREIARWSELVRGGIASEVETALREVLRLATAVSCHSDWLQRRLNDLAGGRGPVGVHRAFADPDEAAAACQRLLRAS